MKLAIKTGPAVEPLTATEAKIHLRLAADSASAAAYTAEDTLIASLITAARVQTEQETGRRLITQTWEYYLDEWPDGDIIIPYPPLQSATIAYKLEDDSTYANSFTDFNEDIVSEPGRLVLQPDESWPTETLYPSLPIKITCVAGYGDTAADVPEPIKAAMLLKISDLYENRGSVVLGVAVNYVQNAIDGLLRQYRIHTRF